MMKEYASSKKAILQGKLRKTLEQLNSLLHDEFPIGDSHKAITVLIAKAERVAAKLDVYETYSDQIRLALAKQVKYILAYSSHILGILARSSTTRNAFELYEPFKKISQSFFDDDIYIIMSSEWSYVPFTYPMNIQELPDFIIIGLPATESSNVLIFPSAAHELGHSIWLKRELSEKYSERISAAVERHIEANEKILQPFMLGLNDKNNSEDNLFARHIKQQFINDATESCSRQLEELFCDFIALGLFGRSYLLAFAYLVSPTDGGPRSKHYPDTKIRAVILARFAKIYGIDVTDYQEEFTQDAQRIELSYDNALLRIADSVRNDFHNDIFEESRSLIAASGNKPPSEDSVVSIVNSYKYGIPTDGNFTMGEILSAAWELFINWDKHSPDDGKPPSLSYISDLVLKSVEAQQFSERVNNA